MEKTINARPDGAAIALLFGAAEERALRKLGASQFRQTFRRALGVHGIREADQKVISIFGNVFTAQNCLFLYSNAEAHIQLFEYNAEEGQGRDNTINLNPFTTFELILSRPFLMTVQKLKRMWKIRNVVS